MPARLSNLVVPNWAEDNQTYLFLREAWHAHLEACDLCNYPRDCFVCDVGDESEHPGPHNCACPARKGGWGYRLGRLYTELCHTLKAADVARQVREERG